MKLDDLCAIKVMGWVKTIDPNYDESAAYWKGADGEKWPYCYNWNPSTSLDDALVCLERACPDGFDIERMPHHPDERLRCVVTANCAQARGLNPSVAIAMCLCSLRAMGVPESEISIAMEI